MKKRFIFCLLVSGFCFMMPASAISEGQKVAIVEKCDTIKDSLRNVQRFDARTRVFFGSHYETVLSKFITPLNLRLVENNMSEANLLENQNDYSVAKGNFVADYISYQQGLEELVAMNCKDEPERFYEKLNDVREKRAKMGTDIVRMRDLTLVNLRLATNVLEGLK